MIGRPFENLISYGDKPWIYLQTCAVHFRNILATFYRFSKRIVPVCFKKTFMKKLRILQKIEMSVFKRDFFELKSTVTIVKKGKAYETPIHIGKKLPFLFFREKTTSPFSSLFFSSFQPSSRWMVSQASSQALSTMANNSWSYIQIKISFKFTNFFQSFEMTYWRYFWHGGSDACANR